MKKYFSLFILFFTTILVFAQDEGIPDRPNPPRLVNNLSVEFPNFLTSNEEQLLEQKLQKFANETSNQIVIVIVDDYKGYENYDFATRLGQKWGVGQAKFDNGIVVLVKPTGGQGKRDLFIAPGYGLEGAIPDLTTKRIRENEMNPYFKQGDYYTGLDKGTDVLMALAKGEYNSTEYGAKNKKGGKTKSILLLIVAVVFIIIFIKGGGGGGFTMGAAGLFLGGGRGGWGGGSSGGSGGFGGFGGGGFGGGGSGGSW